MKSVYVILKDKEKDMYYDVRPEIFYLLSIRNRKLVNLDSKSDGRILEQEVEKAFNKLPILEGGNIYAIYVYNSSVMDVMRELSNRFKDQYPQIQQLPTYFKNFKDGDIFIRHNYSAPMVDLRRSMIRIKALEKSADDNQLDRYFVQTWVTLCLFFDTYSYGFLADKIFVGESDIEKRVCRFCGKSGRNRFKELSHAVQEGLGNKLLFCNEECDECNHYFEKAVERHLYKFLEIPRTLTNVSGKKSRNHHLEGLNFHIHPDPTTLKPVIYVKQEFIYNDIYKGKPTGRIHLYNKGSISFHGIYKALVKIAIDLMPDAKMCHFVKAGQWVHGDFEGKNLPIFLYGEHNEFFSQPVLDLFFKNGRSPKFSPYCTAILYIFDSIFIYTIPFNDIDGERFINSSSLQRHWIFFKQYQYLTSEEWEEIDSNDTKEQLPFYKIPVIPLDDKYDIQFRPSKDEIFKTTQ